MNALKRTAVSLALCSAFASARAGSADLDLTIQIPQLDVAEYHRPYVAAWLERDDRTIASHLLVWYQQKRGSTRAAPGTGAGAANAPGKPAAGAAPAAQGQMGGESGTKWLPDLRQWWRRGGRELSVPIDGVTGATRAVGSHKVHFSEGKAPLGQLAPGQYKLVVEAAREDGGRELVDIPFTWPVNAAQELKAQGKTELGTVTLAVRP